MATNNGKTKRLEFIQPDERQRRSIRKLLANLCFVPSTPEEKAAGIPDPPKNRLAEMGEYRIRPELLELSGMPLEAHFLEAIETLASQGVTPTYEVVQDALAQIIESDEKAEEVTKRIRAHRSIERSVDGIASGIGEWMKAQYLAYMMKTMAEDTVLGPYGTYYDKYQEVMQELGMLAPATKLGKSASHDELWRKLLDLSRVAVERRKQGKSMGPQYPWQQINDMVRGGMEKGDIHLWTGGTKAGKTTFATAIGRHIAMNQPDYLVLMLHLETSQLTLTAREACNEWAIKPGDIREGLIDLENDPTWSAMYKNTLAQMEAKTGKWHESRYWYEHRPGLTITELEGLVIKYKAKAESMGLELVVILDYYQEMGWEELQGAQNETSGLNILATKIKTLVDDYGIYMILFAQEADDEGDRKGRTTPYMAKKIVKRAQAHFRILRGPDDKSAVAEDNYWSPDPHGQPDTWGNKPPSKDGLGRVFYWHKEGQPHSTTRIHLIRGNNVETGIAWLRVANGYFIIREMEPPTKQL